MARPRDRKKGRKWGDHLPRESATVELVVCVVDLSGETKSPGRYTRWRLH